MADLLSDAQIAEIRERAGENFDFRYVHCADMYTDRRALSKSAQEPTR